MNKMKETCALSYFCYPDPLIFCLYRLPSERQFFLYVRCIHSHFLQERAHKMLTRLFVGYIPLVLIEVILEYAREIPPFSSAPFFAEVNHIRYFGEGGL